MIESAADPYGYLPDAPRRGPENPNPSGLCLCGCGQRTKISSRDSNRDGYVRGNPRLFVTGHNMMSGPAYLELDRGYTTPCWIWQRSLTSKGYGALNAAEEGRLAHIVYYVRLHGPVPDGLELDHLCKQRACCNPDHLEAVTHAENCRRGSKTRLTADQVRTIRTSAPRPDTEWARKLGVTPATIRFIRIQRTWKDL